jgi:hypothetical protein
MEAGGLAVGLGVDVQQVKDHGLSLRRQFGGSALLVTGSWSICCGVKKELFAVAPAFDAIRGPDAGEASPDLENRQAVTMLDRSHGRRLQGDLLTNV